MKVKTAVVILMSVLFLITGCVGMTLFPNAEPFCTPEEQVNSIIYKYFDPATADFTLMLGTATFLEKYPEKVYILVKAIEKAKEVLATDGITYDVFAGELVDILGPLQYVVISPLLGNFKKIALPINDCDKRMILGHLNKQLNLTSLVK